MFSKRTGWDLTPNSFSLSLEAARRKGRELLDLTVSNPTTAGFEYPAALLEALTAPAALTYAPDAQGLPAARLAIAEYYESIGAHIRPEQLILTVSTSEAYTYCFRLLCGPGDEVLIARPSYPLFEFLARLQDVKLAPFSLIYDHGWHIDFHSLQHAITPRTRAVIVVHPNNPTGSYVKPEEMAQLAELCAARGLAIISDEVFFDYHLAPSARQSFATGSRALTFTLSGLSKISGLPQMKLAWMAVSGPRELVHAATERLLVIADTYLSPSAPVQHAASALLGFRKMLQPQIIARVREDLRQLDAQLAQHGPCSRLELEGGWYVTIRAPRMRTDEQLALDLIERCGVIVHPGHFFDFESEGHLVLSLITPEAVFAEGLRRLLTHLG